MTKDIGSRILITGGSGFLGINLIRYLLNKGFKDIIALDIADFEYPEKERITFIKKDIRDKVALLSALKDVNLIVHAAAALPLYKKKEIYSTEVDGTKNLLEIAFKNNVGRFIYISSTAVYGIPDHHPIYEGDKLEGVGDYGVAKIKAEEVCNEYKNKGMCVPILRPKSFIGPERLGVFALLYEWAKDKRNFPIIGKGNNRYQLLDIEDLCQAICLCITEDRGVVNDTFNIGAKEFTSLKEDFQSVLDAAGFGKRIVSLPVFPIVIILQLFELLHLSPLYKWIYESAFKDSFVSIEKAQKKLNFKPQYSNKDALFRNYKWFLKNFSSFKGKTGISHRKPWDQGILKIAKSFF